MPRRQKKPGKRRAGKQPKPRASSRAHIEVTARDRDAGKWFAKLVALQARLRGPKGCPWDREQTHLSLRKFLIEEAYEVLDAMDSGNPEEFASELGDLLLQVIFHAILAEEAGRFTISEVIESVHAKMVRRHPHVFGDATAKTSAAVLKNWEQIKRDERTEKGKPPESSLLASVPRSLPAILEAYQLTRRASRIGFDWENLGGILDKLEEEKGELKSLMSRATASNSERDGGQAPHVEEEIGDLFFVCVNIARFLGVDPEIALKRTNRKFKRRFQWMESAAAQEGRRLADLPRARMEELWNLSKAHD
jgi:tetrapyrrole methylase family protein/MazG family protein